MSLKIDRVQLQFEIKPDYQQQELQKLENDLKAANRALTQTERQIEQLKKKKPSDPTAYAKWKKDLADLNQKYDEQVQAVKNAQLAIDKHTEKMGLNNLSLQQLTKRAQTLNTILRNLNPNSEAYQRYNQQLQRINARIKELRGQATATRLSLASMAESMNKYFLLVSSAVGSLTGLALTIRKCTNAYAEMEDVMASVRKYTGQTDEEIRQMNEDFKQMDTRSSREQLNELAGAAGRLGLTARKDIMEFVDGADKIGVALGDDLGEGAVDTIGKLAIAFGEDDRLGLRGAMLATGSALNEIVQNSPAKAQPVIEFTERLSGVGQQAHMTQAQIMGFAAALDQNNQEMATSSTVMSQLITKMYKNPARFAKMAGMEVQKFADLVRTDMNQALVEWLQSVNKLGDMSVLAGKFDELKMDGTRAVGVLSTLAGHVDQVVEAQRIATDAYAEGTSVIKEFEVQNTTVAAEIDKAKKRFADLSIELGGKLLPVARHAITAGSAGVKVLSWLTDTIGRYRGLLVTLTAAYVAYNTVLGIAWAWKNRLVAKTKALTAIETLQKTLTNARTVATGLYNLALGKLTGNLTRASVAQAQLNTAMSANVIGAIVAAAVVLVAVLKDVYDEITKLSTAESMLADAERETRDRAIDERVEMDRLVATVKDANSSEEQRREALEKINGKLMEKHLGNLTEDEILTGKAQRKLDLYNRTLMERIRQEIYLEKLKEAQRKLEAAQDGEFDVSWIQRAQQIAIAFSRGIYGLYHIKDDWNAMNEVFKSEAVKDAQDAVDEITKKLSALNGEMRETERMRDEIHDIPEVEIVADKNPQKKGPLGPSAEELKEEKKRAREREAALRKEVTKARQAMKEKEELAKQERQKADLEAKQAYHQQEITAEEYHRRQVANEFAYLERMTEIRNSKYATDAKRQEIANQVLDATIKEANYQREQEQKRMQDQLELMARSYAADELAIEQDKANGLFSTEQEYQLKRLEAEIDYQTERLAVIRAAGGDVTEAELELEKSRLKLLQFNADERDRLLKRQADKEMESAIENNDFDAQRAIQKRLFDAKLLTAEQYEDALTDITERQEARRAEIRDEFAQRAQQLMQDTSALFSALQSREESRVDAKYKKLIAQAKKQGKDTSKLEEQQEAEKLEIKKKYADKQFLMNVLNIMANTALGISKTIAEWGMPWAVPFVAMTAASGAVQLATAKAQRDQAAGLYTGGYSEEYVEGYTADGDPKEVAGAIPVHKREFVVNHEALKLPMIRRVTDVIDSMQKRRVYSMTDATAELQRAVAAPPLTLPRGGGGLSEGGYSSASGSSSEAMGDGDAVGRLVPLMERNNALLDEMLESGITILELRRQIRRQEQLEKNASR